MLAILDGRTPPPIVKEVIRLGHTPLLLPPSPLLPSPIASHPDMLLFFAKDAVFTTESYLSVAPRELSQISRAAALPLKTVSGDFGSTYPADILLNAATVGMHLFCHPSATAKEIREQPDRIIHFVRQGYAKCATLPIGESALISADPSILSAAKAAGSDTLAVSCESIRLPGYDCGFVGGCASFAPYRRTDTVLFCGNLQKHPDGKRMEEFARSHGVGLYSLGNNDPLDIGTVFLI